MLRKREFMCMCTCMSNLGLRFLVPKCVVVFFFLNSCIEIHNISGKISTVTIPFLSPVRG